MTKSEQINELAAALAEAQFELNNATKDGNNPFFKSQYSTLASVREALRVSFNDHGLSVVQTLARDEHGVVVETTLLHKSGQFIGGALSVKPVKDDPQGIGSAITYARRYSLAAIAGIASEDDDGESAMGREEKPTPSKVAVTTTPVSTEKMNTAVSMLEKAGEFCDICQPVEKSWTPHGKKMRVKFVGDPTHYVLESGEIPKTPGDKMTATITMKETETGAIYYAITGEVPF